MWTIRRLVVSVVILAAVISLQSFSQMDADVRVMTLSRNDGMAAQDTVYFVMVEDMPEPIGGIVAIQKNVRYPEIAKRARIEGTVYLEVFVGELGNVVKTDVVKGVHPALDSAATQAVAQVKFKAGMHQGKAVKTRLAIPIRFRIGAKRTVEKHTLYPGNYEIRAGAIVVPDRAEWRAFDTKAHPDKSCRSKGGKTMDSGQ